MYNPTTFLNVSGYPTARRRRVLVLFLFQDHYYVLVRAQSPNAPLDQTATAFFEHGLFDSLPKDMDMAVAEVARALFATRIPVKSHLGPMVCRFTPNTQMTYVCNTCCYTARSSLELMTHRAVSLRCFGWVLSQQAWGGRIRHRIIPSL